MKHMFNDPDGTFSWRKAGTAICFICYAYCVIGYGITHNFDEIPTSYQVIMGGVFSFYFVKKSLENISISNKDQSK